MGSRRLSRTLAFQALYSWDLGRQAQENYYSFSWLTPDEAKDVDEETGLFARVLIGGTIENIETIDALVSHNLKYWELNRLAKVDLAILRMSTYALHFLKDIPAKVTIDEAVDLAKKYASEDSYRFINGVLDGIRRELGL